MARLRLEAGIALSRRVSSFEFRLIEDSMARIRERPAKSFLVERVGDLHFPARPQIASGPGFQRGSGKGARLAGECWA
jgi:hypothetical protein